MPLHFMAHDAILAAGRAKFRQKIGVVMIPLQNTYLPHITPQGLGQLNISGLIVNQLCSSSLVLRDAWRARIPTLSRRIHAP
jgi:hypothetical protein